MISIHNEPRPVFSDRDRPHPDWELNQSTQRHLSFATIVVVLAAIGLNLAGGHHQSRWPSDQSQKGAVAAADRAFVLGSSEIAPTILTR